MLSVPRAGNDAGPEGSGGIETAACVVYTDHLGDEEGHADSHRRHEGGFVLFVGEHVNGEDQLGGEEGFDLFVGQPHESGLTSLKHLRKLRELMTSQATRSSSH